MSTVFGEFARTHACVGMCRAAFGPRWKTAAQRGRCEAVNNRSRKERSFSLAKGKTWAREGGREDGIWHNEHKSMEEHSDLPRLAHRFSGTRLSGNVVDSLPQGFSVQYRAK